MKRPRRICALFLALVLPVLLFSGCFGGPGVEPPFSSETGDTPPLGPENDYAGPAGGEQDGVVDGEQGADDRDSEQPAPVPGSEGAGEPAADTSDNDLTPTGLVGGDGGVLPDAEDAGVESAEAGTGDAGWVQDELFFE